MKRFILAVLLLLPAQVFADQCLKKTTAPDYSGFDDFSSVNQSCDASGNLRVTATISPSGTQNVNLTQVGGAAVAQGGGVAAPAVRVELPTDGTGVVGLNAGTKVIGHVIADTGSTTAVTGNVTVVQPTGTNLHAVLDTASTTAVTQATAANLNATVVGTGTFATQSSATQSGTWTVQPGNTANTTPWLFTGGSQAATYSVGGNGYTAYATPQDLLCITGSGTKTVYVTRLTINIQSTAAALQTILFIKRSTANSGGSLTNPALVPYDSTNAAATATVILYTGAPTPGTSLGTLRVQEQASSTVAVTPPVIDLYTASTLGTTVSLTQPVILRGTAESVCANYNGAALTVGFTAAYLVEEVER